MSALATRSEATRGLHFITTDHRPMNLFVLAGVLIDPLLGQE